MKEFKKIEAIKEHLERFYNGSALTIEGLSEDSFGDWVECLGDVFEETPTVFKVTGKLMNDTYHLTGSNSYPEDLTIAVIELDNFKEETIGKISVQRFSYGGRWFDDIVDNNSRREGN